MDIMRQYGKNKFYLSRDNTKREEPWKQDSERRGQGEEESCESDSLDHCMKSWNHLKAVHA